MNSILFPNAVRFAALPEPNGVPRTLVDGIIEYRHPHTDLLHRLDGPAVLDPEGYQAWYQNGKLHRLNGPAYTGPNGSQFWYQDGEAHRTDGPAIIHSAGYQAWFQNGFLHRLDGPAVEASSVMGNKYYVYGKRTDPQDYHEAVRKFIIKTLDLDPDLPLSVLHDWLEDYGRPEWARLIREHHLK